MPVEKDLAEFLQIPEGSDDEETSSSITALLTSCVYDDVPHKTLPEIYHILTTHDATKYLDPLNALPLLLRIDHPAARDLISLLSQCGSAKEVVMAAQEILEGLERSYHDEESDREETTEIVKSDTKPFLPRSPINQLVILVDVLATVIPKLKSRRKSASETIKPIFQELGNIVNLSIHKATMNEARSLLVNVSDLAKRVAEWNQDVNNSNEVDKEECKAILGRLLETTISACEHQVQSDIAQRTLEKCYPRFAFRSQVRPDSEEGKRIMLDVLTVAKSLGMRGPTMDLIFTAYEPSPDFNPPAIAILSRLLPALTSSIHSNRFLDESLAILINALYTHSVAKPKASLPDEVILPLCGLLPSVASVHPNGSVRHQTFRVLSLLLQACDSQLRFHQLIELTKDSDYPQMRTAAVGLVKEALLESLASHQKNDPFLGSLFLRSFGPILFRPNPPDLLSCSLSLKEFQESNEPSRLVECLSLYYVILQRDDKNQTGIRDKDVVKSVENNLLKPLQRSIDNWMRDPAVSNSHIHDITAVVSLKVSLDRIEIARNQLHLV